MNEQESTTEYTQEFRRRTKTRCTRCWGRGFIGKEVGTGVPVKCRCTSFYPIPAPKHIDIVSPTYEPVVINSPLYSPCEGTSSNPSEGNKV